LRACIAWSFAFANSSSPFALGEFTFAETISYRVPLIAHTDCAHETVVVALSTAPFAFTSESVDKLVTTGGRRTVLPVSARRGIDRVIHALATV
jgi:hypothetical protein